MVEVYSTPVVRAHRAQDGERVEHGKRRMISSLARPNGSRLSCGALKKDSFPNLRAPQSTRAASFRRLLGGLLNATAESWCPTDYRAR